MDFFEDLITAIGKALMHTIFAVLFGFLQILAVYFLCEMSEGLPFKIQDFYDAGFFLFFTVAIISTAITDFYFDARVKTNRYFDAFIIVTSLGVCAFCMLAFSKIFLQFDTTNQKFSAEVQEGFLVFGVAESFLLKLMSNFKRP